MAGSSSVFTRGRLEEPDHSSSNWYYTRDDIENNSPSKNDGIDLKKEAYLRKSYCTFLQDLGMRLKVPQITIATAIVFCHRFFLRQSHHKNDRYMIATVCMFLAGKVEETPKPLRDVIFVSYEIRYKKDPAAVQRVKQKQVYEEQKELMLLGERLVLATLCFDLNIHHPYKPLVAAIKKFKVAQNALAQVAWNFVNDGLRTSLCLQFKPHHIAAGAIFLAAKFLKVKLPSEGDKVWWQEFDVTPRQLEEVSNQMLELYEQNREGAASRSSDPGASTDVKNRDDGPSLRTARETVIVKEATTYANGFSNLPQQCSPCSSVAAPKQPATVLGSTVRTEDDRVPARHVKQINGLVDPQKRHGPGDAPAYHNRSNETGFFPKSSTDDFPKPEETFTHENKCMLGKQEFNTIGANMELLKHGDSKHKELHADETFMGDRSTTRIKMEPTWKTARLVSMNEGGIRGQEACVTKNYDDNQPFSKIIPVNDGAERNGIGESTTRISATDGMYSYHSHHQPHNSLVVEREQHHYGDKEWQEREYKKPRYDHGK